MDVSRRELLKFAASLASVRTILALDSVAAILALQGCGGGGGSSDGGTTAPSVKSPKISSVSTSNPQALTPLYVSTSGLDVNSAYTVTFTSDSGSQVSMTPIRTQSDGTIVLAMPLTINASNGQTSGQSGTIQLSQNGVISNAVQITIADLPSLADLGLQLGQLSQAFNTYQTVSLGRNINAHQAIGMFPGANGVPGALVFNLQNQLLATINSRNIIDNIVADPTYSHTSGSALDGTDITFNQSSVEILDRVLAQYLAVLTNQSAVNLSSALLPTLMTKQDIRHYTVQDRSLMAVQSQPSAITVQPKNIDTIVNGITGLNGVFNLFSTTQTTLSDNSSAVDKLLSVASTGASLIAIGATVVAATAAAPEVAAGAIVVAAYASLSGIAIGTAMIGNDIHNIYTNNSTLATAASGSPEYALAYAQAQSATTNLEADTVSTVLNLVGVGAFAPAAEGLLATASFKILDQVVAPTASDVALGLGQLITSTANIYYQGQFEEDINNAKANAGQLPATLAPNQGFASIDGQVSISNPNGTILSPLTGIAAGNNSNLNLLTSMADSGGSYSLVIPLDSSSLDYYNVAVSAYDPITSTELNSEVVDMSALSPGQINNAPTMTGTCNDYDVSYADGDDPDCD